MPKPPRVYSDQALKTITVLRRDKMAWVVFWIFVVLFVAGLSCLIYSVVTCREKFTAFNLSLSLIDTIVGWGLRSIVANLFPKPPR